MSDLPNALLFLVLCPHNGVHFIQALAALFVRLQLYLAVLEGHLESNHTTV